MFHTDSHSVIGKVHLTQNKLCQDHALSFASADSAIIVVSDGCSTGGHTDIGARLTTCSVLKNMRNGAGDNYDIAGDLALLRDQLGLVNKDLLATCIYCTLSESGGVIKVFGDGCIVMKFQNGNSIAYRLEWANNTPLYPVYTKGNLRESFLSVHLAQDSGKDSLKVTTVYNIDGEASEFAEQVPILTAIDGCSFEIGISEMKELEFVALFSDGVEQFGNSDLGHMSFKEVVKELTNFKTMNGEFVKRRMSAAIKKYAKEGIEHHDDLSMAVIYIDNKKETE